MTIRQKKSVFLFLCVVLSIVGTLGVKTHQLIHQDPLQTGQGDYVFLIPPGTSVMKIAQGLSREGLFKYPYIFVGWVQMTRVGNKLQAGEYLIKHGTTLEALVTQIVEGRVLQHALTVVEGWDFKRLMTEMRKEPALVHTLHDCTPEEVMAQLGYPGEKPEGQFLPETYYFPAGTTDVSFLQRAHRLLQTTLQQAWENRAEVLPLKTPYEALILASIVEKESSVVEEYADISGVYIRRLMRNMLLQADPTVIYGLGERYAGVLNNTLLQDPSPYNTYVHVGLPPTPIAMPSAKALYAATHPSVGEALYFVASASGKGHVFSKTLTEHQSAVEEYRKFRQNVEKK